MNTFTPEQFEIMEVAGITEDEVWVGSEIEKIKPNEKEYQSNYQ